MTSTTMYYLPQFHFHGFNQKQNNNDSIVITQCLWLWTSWPLTNKIIWNLHLYFFLTWLISYLVIRESFRAILYILQPNRNRIESLIQLKSSLSKSWWKLWLFIGTSIWNHSPTMHTPFHPFSFTFVSNTHFKRNWWQSLPTITCENFKMI